MNWLRRGHARLRALLLLIAFAIGSIFARDALLVQQILALQAEAAAQSVEEPCDDPEWREDDAPARTIRPSGLSRRTAMNPFDPPDDDDELDQDSDTLAVGHLVFTIAPCAAGALLAAFVPVSHPRTELVDGSSQHVAPTLSARAPPAPLALG